MYALVISDAIQTVQSNLPSGAKRLDDGAWITPYNGQWTVTEHQACGWFAVTDSPKPADTPTHTHDQSFELVGGVPTMVWTQRPKTQAEIDQATQQSNLSAIETNLTTDMANMQAIIDATNATINTNPAVHIKNIARMNKRLGRKALNDYSAAD